ARDSDDKRGRPADRTGPSPMTREMERQRHPRLWLEVDSRATKKRQETAKETAEETAKKRPKKQGDFVVSRRPGGFAQSPQMPHSIRVSAETARGRSSTGANMDAYPPRPRPRRETPLVTRANRA